MQRRVEQPDRDRQPVHRLEDADEVLALQRQQLVQRASPLRRRCRRGSAARRARAARRGTCARCGTARCPGRRSGGPGRRPRRCRRWPAPTCRRTPSACAMIRSTAPTSSSASSAPRASPSKYCTTGESTTGTSPRKTSPVVPSIEMTSPSSISTPPRRAHAAALGVDVELLGAADAGLAHAAGDDGGVRGLAAAAGEDARARRSCRRRSSGLVSRRTRMTVLARARPLRPRCRSRRRPCRPRRRARRSCPGAIFLRRRVVVEAREHQLRELRAGDPRAAPRPCRSGPGRRAGWRCGTPPPRCACRPGSAASTACRARW